MKCAALTGISSLVISELKMGKPRTLELHSANNIITLTAANPGDCIFLTTVDLDDLAAGDGGIIVTVVSLTVTMKRVIEYVNPLYYEERERMTARIQVKYSDSTFAKSVEGKSWMVPTFVEIVRPACWHAG